MKNTISELKNTVEEESKTGYMKHRIQSVTWRTREKKNPQKEQEKEKRLKKNKEGSRACRTT